MKPTLSDLAMVMFEQIERINDDELTGDALSEQVTKTKTIGESATVILKIADLGLKAAKLESEGRIDTMSADTRGILGVGDQPIGLECKGGSR